MPSYNLTLCQDYQAVYNTICIVETWHHDYMARIKNTLDM